MRILMLGNSFTFTNDMPKMLAGLTGAEVVQHTRGGAHLAEHLDPDADLGSRTQAALANERWDYVIIQELSHGPITAPERFFSSVKQLCRQAKGNGAVPVLYATWPYQQGGAKLAGLGLDYEDMAHRLFDAYHQAARENGALVADVGQRFYELSETQNLYVEDGFHPNESGSRIAAELLASVILNHREGRA